MVKGVAGADGDAAVAEEVAGVAVESVAAAVAAESVVVVVDDVESVVAVADGVVALAVDAANAADAGAVELSCGEQANWGPSGERVHRLH